MKNIALIGTILLSSVASYSATAATINSTITQTISGQNFNHVLAGPASDGTGATITFTQRGDFFDSGSHNENLFVLSIDGNVLGTNVAWDDASAYNSTSYGFDDKEFSIDYFISGALFSSLFSDNMANVFVDFGSGMNAFSSAYYSSVSLAYNDGVSAVPVPAAIWFMGSGLLGLMGFSRKNKKLAA